MDSSELLTILEQLERDKGIDKEVLIEAANIHSAGVQFYWYPDAGLSEK